MSNKGAQRQRQTSTHYHDAARHQQEAAHEVANYKEAADRAPAAAEQQRQAAHDAEEVAKQATTPAAADRK